MFQMLVKIARFMGPRRGTMCTALVFSVLGTMFQSAPIGALYLMVTHSDDLTSQVGVLVTICLVGLFGTMACKAVTQVILAPLGFQLFADERIAIGDRLKSAPMGYFNSTRLGDITAAVTTVMADAEMYLVFMFEKVISALLSYVMVLLFLIWVDWRVGVVGVVMMAVALAFVAKINTNAARIMPKRQRVQQNVVAQVLEFLGGAALFRSFNSEEIVAKRLYHSFRDSSQFSFSAEMDIVPPTLGYQLTLRWGSLLLVALPAGLYLSGSASLSVVLLLVVASFVMTAPLEGLTGDLAILRMTAASLDIVDGVRTAPTQVADPAYADPKERSQAERPGSSEAAIGEAANPMAIEFQDVSFSYADRLTLRSVSASLPTGSTTALIGPSGSGKTTMCNLMMRFWDVDAGSVQVWGRDVRGWEPDELLSQFAVVFQDVYLFSDTVANNIRLGRPDADMEQVRAAAARARCLEFVEALPEGFDTVLAEGGASLSGGERQRISIARAILKDAPLVILDEATSSVDPENERELQLALNELCVGKTRVVIAHNMATVRDADQILVFDEGRIVQCGRHEELERAEGIYRDFLSVRSRTAGWRINH